MVGVPTSAVKTASSAAASLTTRARYCGWIGLRPGVPLASSSRPCARLLVMRDAVVEMAPVGLCRQLRQQRRERGADVADEAEIEFAAAAEVLGPDVDLRDLGVGRQELLVGKIGPEHQQHVAGVHGGVAGGKADEAGHADVIGIVVFDMLLAAERMHHRALQRLRELHQRSMRARAAAAAKQRHAIGRVEQCRRARPIRAAPG